MGTILSDDLSCRFKNMALLCAVLVIMIHCVSAFGVRFSYVDRIARDGICRIAFPFFFFASGFFLAGHCHEEGWWKRALRSRVQTLVIPFLVRARGFVLWLPMTLGVIVITFGIVVFQRRWFSSLNRYLYGGR